MLRPTISLMKVLEMEFYLAAETGTVVFLFAHYLLVVDDLDGTEAIETESRQTMVMVIGSRIEYYKEVQPCHFHIVFTCKFVFMYSVLKCFNEPLERVIAYLS